MMSNESTDDKSSRSRYTIGHYSVMNIKNKKMSCHVVVSVDVSVDVIKRPVIGGRRDFVINSVC